MEKLLLAGIIWATGVVLAVSLTDGASDPLFWFIAIPFGIAIGTLI